MSSYGEPGGLLRFTRGDEKADEMSVWLLHYPSIAPKRITLDAELKGRKLHYTTEPALLITTCMRTRVTPSIKEIDREEVAAI